MEEGDSYQYNQQAHVGGGCLGDEEEQRKAHGINAMMSITNQEIYDFYNKIRQSLNLPSISKEDRFNLWDYCFKGRLPLIEDINAEYTAFMDFIYKRL